MSIDQLIADAAACRQCGKEHALRGQPHGVTWADPDDGHPYFTPTISVEWLREWRERHRMDAL